MLKIPTVGEARSTTMASSSSISHGTQRLCHDGGLPPRGRGGWIHHGGLLSLPPSPSPMHGGWKLHHSSWLGRLDLACAPPLWGGGLLLFHDL